MLPLTSVITLALAAVSTNSTTATPNITTTTTTTTTTFFFGAADLPTSINPVAIYERIMSLPPAQQKAAYDEVLENFNDPKFVGLWVCIQALDIIGKHGLTADPRKTPACAAKLNEEERINAYFRIAAEYATKPASTAAEGTTKNAETT